MSRSAQKLTSLTDGLQFAKINYRLAQNRDDAIMIEIAIPGERWEVEFMEDGSVEVEVFKSDGHIRDNTALRELFVNHSA